jgi:hypothetical protein
VLYVLARGRSGSSSLDSLPAFVCVRKKKIKICFPTNKTFIYILNSMQYQELSGGMMPTIHYNQRDSIRVRHFLYGGAQNTVTVLIISVCIQVFTPHSPTYR